MWGGAKAAPLVRTREDYALSGRECPGCGITRAVSCCLHGEFERATEFNLGVVVVFPLLLLLAGRQFARRTLRPTL